MERGGIGPPYGGTRRKVNVHYGICPAIAPAAPKMRVYFPAANTTDNGTSMISTRRPTPGCPAKRVVRDKASLIADIPKTPYRVRTAALSRVPSKSQENHKEQHMLPPFQTGCSDSIRLTDVSATTTCFPLSSDIKYPWLVSSRIMPVSVRLTPSQQILSPMWCIRSCSILFRMSLR